MSKKRSKNKKKNHSRLYVIEAVAVIGLALGAGIFTMVRAAGTLTDEQNAIKIDGKKYSVSDVNYFYNTYYDSFCKQNSEYLPYMFDQDESLKEQEYEDGVSWFDYFLDESIQSMVNVVKVSDAAREDGFSLGEESRDQIQEYLDGLSLAAENMDITADEYASRIYGKDMTLKRYGELLEMSFLAKDYMIEQEEKFACSDDEIEKYYEDNRQLYEYADYERLFFRAGSQDQEPSDEERSQAENLAQKALGEVQSGRKLEDVAKEYEDAVYYAADEAYYSDGYSYGQWLFLDERKPGDSTVIDNGDGYYVMVFHDRSRHDYPAVNVRDICFEIDDSAENKDEEYEESCEKAEELYQEWKDGGGTEELFIDLAEENPSSQSPEGGLYEKVTRDSLDSSLAAWCFDQEHKAGDCEVVYADNGFHVLYFEGYDEPAWKIEVEDDIRETRLSDWLNELNESAQVDRNEKALENTVGL